jgi:hypothetical protein
METRLQEGFHQFVAFWNLFTSGAPLPDQIEVKAPTYTKEERMGDSEDKHRQGQTSKVGSKESSVNKIIIK